MRNLLSGRPSVPPQQPICGHLFCLSAASVSYSGSPLLLLLSTVRYMSLWGGDWQTPKSGIDNKRSAARSYGCRRRRAFGIELKWKVDEMVIGGIKSPFTTSTVLQNVYCLPIRSHREGEREIPLIAAPRNQWWVVQSTTPRQILSTGTDNYRAINSLKWQWFGGLQRIIKEISCSSLCGPSRSVVKLSTAGEGEGHVLIFVHSISPGAFSVAEWDEEARNTELRRV